MKIIDTANDFWHYHHYYTYIDNLLQMFIQKELKIYAIYRKIILI